jgi:hypothetical protein
MSKLESKKPYSMKSIYDLPTEKANYLVVLQSADDISSTCYIISVVKYLKNYIQKAKNKRMFLVCYFVKENINVDVLEQYREDTKIYIFENLDILNKIIEEKFNVNPIYPKIHRKPNPLLNCRYCETMQMRTNDDIIQHLLDCYKFRYTLFGLDVPKECLKYTTTKATVKKVFNTTNNINVTNNYQFNISVRQVGDFLREKLPDSEKIRILNSMDKIGEMVRQHFLFPEINRTLCVKNSNMYTGHSVCFDGKDFVTKPNRDVFEYYILDLLDSCDYFADDFKKAESLEKSEIDRLIRNLDKYDSNIRKNDKVMREKIQRTIAQVKDLQGKIK